MTTTQAKNLTLRRLLPHTTFFSDDENLEGDCDEQDKWNARYDDLAVRLGLGDLREQLIKADNENLRRQQGQRSPEYMMELILLHLTDNQPAVVFNCLLKTGLLLTNETAETLHEELCMTFWLIDEEAFDPTELKVTQISRQRLRVTYKNLGLHDYVRSRYRR